MRSALLAVVIVSLLGAPVVLAGVATAGQEGIQAGQTKAVAASPEQLVGRWSLNPSLSEIPKRPEGGRRGGPGGGMGGPGGGQGGPGGGMGGFGGGFGGPGGGMGGPGGGMGGPPSGGMGDPGKGEGGARRGGRGEPGGPSDPVTGAASLMVQLDGLTVKLVSGEGRVRSLGLDGQPAKRQRGPGTATETALFKDGRIEISTVPEHGPKVAETLGLAEDGSGRLVHTVLMPRPDSDEPVRAVYVYDPESGAR